MRRASRPPPSSCRERRDRHPGDVLHRDRLLVVGQHVRRRSRQDPKARVQTRQHRAQAAVPQRDHDPKLQAVLRPPPTPSRRAAHFPASPDIRRRMSGGTRSPPGRGGLPQFPSSPSERSTPSTPGSSSRLHPGSAPLPWPSPCGRGSALPASRSRGHVHGAAGFASCCGPLSRSP